MTDDPGAHPNFIVRNGVLLFNGKVWIPANSVLQPLLLAEFHTTPTGGHAGIQRIFARIVVVFYWPDLRRFVREFVAWCTVCQTSKPFNKAPQGLLQPLPIPGKIWHLVSMDFIVGLPPSNGKTTILVIVDRLSKHAHFAALGPQFTAPQVAELLVLEVIKIHGIPAQIISDRDPVFMCSFWSELFTLQGTMFAHSSAYHPQTDGQTEVLNRCLEDYLRCFAADNPQSWSRFLSWAE